MPAQTQITCTKSEFAKRLRAEFRNEHTAERWSGLELDEVIDGLVRQANAHAGVFTGHSAYLDLDFTVSPDWPTETEIAANYKALNMADSPDEITTPAVTDAQRGQERIAVRGTMRDVRTSLAGMLEGAFTLSPEGLDALADRLRAAAGHLRIAAGARPITLTDWEDALSAGPVTTPNPHYACDTHGAVCPTGEHTLHSPANPCEGCAKCALRPELAGIVCYYCPDHDQRPATGTTPDGTATCTQHIHRRGTRR